METRAARLLFLGALIAGGSYYATHWITVAPAADVVWKGAGVGLLAVWAALQARDTDGWLIAAALALGAAGDVLLETHGLTIGAVAFLAGHVVAATLYLRNRSGPILQVLIVTALVGTIPASLVIPPADLPGILLYATALGVMCGTAWASRFPRWTVKLGALLFVISDMLLFAQIGQWAGNPLPGLLIWPTYFAGQALIAWGVVRSLRT